MDWKFWEKKQPLSNGSNGPKIKMSGPKDIPEVIGIYLISHVNSDPDFTWSLKCVLRRHPDKKSRYDFRIFNPNQRGIENTPIKDYTSLDNRPELILFQGMFDKQTYEVELKKGVSNISAVSA